MPFWLNVLDCCLFYSSFFYFFSYFALFSVLLESHWALLELQLLNTSWFRVSPSALLLPSAGPQSAPKAVRTTSGVDSCAHWAVRDIKQERSVKRDDSEIDNVRPFPIGRGVQGHHNVWSAPRRVRSHCRNVDIVLWIGRTHGWTDEKPCVVPTDCLG